MPADVNVGGTLSTGGSPYPIVRDTEFAGGMRVVSTTASRDAIFDANKKIGMLVCVQTGSIPNFMYQLSGTNPDVWIPFQAASSSSFEYVGTFVANSSSITFALNGDIDDAYMIDISFKDYNNSITGSSGGGIQLRPNGADADCSSTSFSYIDGGTISPNARGDWQGIIDQPFGLHTPGTVVRSLVYILCNRNEGFVSMHALSHSHVPDLFAVKTAAVTFGSYRGGNLTSLTAFDTRSSDPHWQVILRRMRRQP